jgi:hypothetical protein
MVFVSVIALLIVTQGQTLINKKNDSMHLTVQMTDSNSVSLNWETIFEANYYKIFRAEVTAAVDSTTEDIKYVELGISETNEFLDNYIKKDGENTDAKTTKESMAYLYYVTAIDAWEKEISKSDIVKFSLNVKIEEIQ